jgi:hypothetical protein
MSSVSCSSPQLDSQETEKENPLVKDAVSNTSTDKGRLFRELDNRQRDLLQREKKKTKERALSLKFSQEKRQLKGRN